MGPFDAIRPGLASVAMAAERTGVPEGIFLDLIAAAPPSFVYYRGRLRLPLLTDEDIEAATGLAP